MSAIIVRALFPRFLRRLRGKVPSKARARQWRRDNESELRLLCNGARVVCAECSVTGTDGYL